MFAAILRSQNQFHYNRNQFICVCGVNLIDTDELDVGMERHLFKMKIHLPILIYELREKRLNVKFTL